MLQVEIFLVLRLVELCWFFTAYHLPFVGRFKLHPGITYAGSQLEENISANFGYHLPRVAFLKKIILLVGALMNIGCQEKRDKEGANNWDAPWVNFESNFNLF